MAGLAVGSLTAATVQETPQQHWEVGQEVYTSYTNLTKPNIANIQILSDQLNVELNVLLSDISSFASHAQDEEGKEASENVPKWLW